jgi:hypothetical protein
MDPRKQVKIVASTDKPSATQFVSYTMAGFGPGCVKTQKVEIFMGRVTPPGIEKIALRPF